MKWCMIPTRFLSRNAVRRQNRELQKASEGKSISQSYTLFSQWRLGSQSNRNGPELEQIIANVTRADKLFDQGNVHSAPVSVTLSATAVKGTAEAILYFGILLQATQGEVRHAQAMKSGAGAFDVDDFVERLITFMGGRNAGAALLEDSDSETEDERYSGGPLDWERVGCRALMHSHRIATMNFMYVAPFMRSMRHNVFI